MNVFTDDAKLMNNIREVDNATFLQTKRQKFNPNESKVMNTGMGENRPDLISVLEERNYKNKSMKDLRLDIRPNVLRKSL